MKRQGASLIRADATSIPLGDNSVDLICTSPPFFALRSYQDGGEHYGGQIGSEPTPAAFLEALWAVTAECNRVLKPSGSMFVNLGDKYVHAGSGGVPTYSGSVRGVDCNGMVKAAGAEGHGIPTKSLMGMPWRYALGCIDQLGLILRAEIVWSKPNGLPESVTDRVRRSHEQWFHFTKEPRYFAAVDEVREAYAPGTVKKYEAGGLVSSIGDATHPSKANQQKQRLDGDEADWRGNPLGKLPGSVWEVPSEPLAVPDWLGVDHFAAFPQEWPRRLILGWSPSGICCECGEGRRPVVEKEYSDSEKKRGLVKYGDGGGDGFTAATGWSAMPSKDMSTTTWRVFESGHAEKSKAKSNRDAQGTLL